MPPRFKATLLRSIDIIYVMLYVCVGEYVFQCAYINYSMACILKSHD